MARRNSKQIYVLAGLLCHAAMMADALGSDTDLYDTLVQRMTTMPIQRGHGLLPDVSAEVCSIVTSKQLERLSDTRPDDVSLNVGLSENATGFPPGTTHWLVRGQWLETWERMSLAINVNDAGFCLAFYGPLTLEEPNFNFDRNGMDAAAMSSPNTDEIVVAGRHGSIAECLQNRTQTEGWNVKLDGIEEGVIVSATMKDGRSEWSVTFSRFQAFQSVSTASITYGTTPRDTFHRDIWPLIEDCGSASS